MASTQWDTWDEVYATAYVGMATMLLRAPAERPGCIVTLGHFSNPLDSGYCLYCDQPYKAA